MSKKFIEGLQNHIATVAIGTSTLRGKGNAGAKRAAQDFLKRVKLDKFNVRKEVQFLKRLNSETHRLASFFRKRPTVGGRKNFRKGGPGWGGARKSLNIFLRDVVYCAPLAIHFKLRQLWPWLEIPLDGDVTRRLKEERGAGLPDKFAIVRLKKVDSDKYQEVARKVAKREKMKRLDLDMCLRQK